ncbi:IclR family transcriptional regulator [Solirubrobacter sp. CPCC 204708]|uniref:IclR family transcriptional regulator n=1 Tax=Solirubrobacter deserti TaxID=2282478 RepID=A0ABT4RRM4_9ACTN|nr:IclR family transcriptional regulator [Solirubrobacter deserti]MBE2314883.1 IclR family transcriptional regulator [Solirubrobacter deserti]MDA0141110.1 IclR family transcriptional regulator [Solirubrobacter deserti]
MANAPAASHALKVLRLLARHAQPLPAATIATALGLPRSSTYHLLKVLADEGFVVHLPEQRRYGLGVAAHEIGSAYLKQEPLRWIAQTVLTRLTSATTHNAHLAVLHGRDVLYVIEERAPDRPDLVTDVGVRLPAHLTASGLAMLAALPQPQLQALFPDRSALTRRNNAGPASLKQLRATLTTARERGYAEEDGYVTPGLASVATAVLDHARQPIAAVAVTFPADADKQDLAQHTMRAAKQIAARIRGVSP